jgi:hypothetical protein
MSMAFRKAEKGVGPFKGLVYSDLAFSVGCFQCHYIFFPKYVLGQWRSVQDTGLTNMMWNLIERHYYKVLDGD